jgi:hypothetical protein
MTPHVNDGAVKSITQVGDMIVVVGTFTSVSQLSNGSNPLTRNRIFALTPQTGVIDPSFNPNLDGCRPTRGFRRHARLRSGRANTRWRRLRRGHRWRS